MEIQGVTHFARPNLEGNQYDSLRKSTAASTANIALSDIQRTLADAIGAKLGGFMQAITGKLSIPTTTHAPSFSSSAAKLLSGDAQGMIHEEELQHAMLEHLLGKVSPQAQQVYAQALNAAISTGNTSYEDAAKLALQTVVKAGLIDLQTAEKIHGIAFRAAQLDNNLEALYDGKGGKTDPTIAVMEKNQALALAEKTLAQIEKGEIDAPPRQLDAPSNQKPQTSGRQSQGSGGDDGGISNTFLWKPEAEKDGKLVILIPANLAQDVASVEVYANGQLLEKGKAYGIGNGSRAHFRFSKPGSDFPDGSTVLVRLNSGKTVTYHIGDTASRITK
ncbi:hypothetical protein JNK13_05765 [bacterium]|nr:hypothetical protein [bacterium]